MKKKARPLWHMENGEILCTDLHRDTARRYRADTPFDHPIAPYLILAFCASVDGAVFYSLFSAISYDRPLMLMVQIAGFLFGFDVVPIYIGIHLRRLRQGLSRDAFILWLALAACVTVCAMNIVLRAATMDSLNPAPVLRSGFLGNGAAAPEEDDTAIALTVFGIGIPMVTSLGSFFISYLTYHPLQIRSRREEALITEKRDEIRRLEAILADYDAETDFADHLEADDRKQYEQMQRAQRALVLHYCDYARQRLKEHLGDPVSCNILSEETCSQLMARLTRELVALEEKPEIPAAKLPEILPVSRPANVRRVQ